ncbi:MAG: NYN domain-containing protein [Terriglobia bacterium]
MRQKRVDILLALDMVNHAIQRNMAKALLIAGDDDFVPVLESLVPLGMIGEVIADARHVSPHLISSADKYRAMTIRQYHHWVPVKLQAQFTLPGCSNASAKPDGEACRTGHLGGNVVQVFSVAEGYRAYPSFDNSVYTHEDQNRLISYLEFEYGPIIWKPAVTS